MSEPQGGPSPSAMGWKDPHARFFLLLLGIGIAAFWLPRLPGSFWTDETVTAWVTDGSFREMLDRAVSFQATPPTYYVLAWAVRLVDGESEIALRMPSLLAMGLALCLLYRLGRRLFDAEVGIVAAVVLAIWNEGAHLATDARPYAIGVLLFVASTLSLVRWLDEGHTRHVVAYVALAALVVYVHYVLAAALPAHAVYIWRRRSDLPSRSAAVIGSAAFVFVLAPLVPHLLTVLEQRAALSLGMQSIGATLLVIAPPTLLAGMAAGIALTRGRLKLEDASAPRPGALALMGTWAAGPPLLLFAASWIGGAGVLGPQHVTQSAPALALLAASAIRRLGPARARRILLVTIAIVSLLFGASRRQYGDDWRGAIARSNGYVDASTPVLVRSGLAESGDVDWLRDDGRGRYLLAPVNVYPTKGTPVLLPYDLGPAERGYLESEVVPIAESSERFAVIALAVDDAVLPWLQGRLGGSGYSLRRLERFGSVTFALFERV